MYSVSKRRLIQYSVSFASLSEMLNLLIKSALDCPNSASLISAPIEVPLRRICLLKTYSFLSDCNY